MCAYFLVTQIHKVCYILSVSFIEFWIQKQQQKAAKKKDKILMNCNSTIQLVES